MTELERQLIDTDSHIEKLESLYKDWKQKLPVELSQLIAQGIFAKKADNDVTWANIPSFTQLTLTETRRIYCYTCDQDYDANVEIGGESQFLKSEHCKYCGHQDLDLLDVDTDASFNSQLNLFEQ